MGRSHYFGFIIFCTLILTSGFLLIPSKLPSNSIDKTKISSNEQYFIEQQNLKSSQLPSENFSSYNLTVVFDEDEASVEGNLTVDFYNNDPINFTQLPFHLYLSGMMYETQPGSIEILKIYDYENHSQYLSYQVYSSQQLMWITLNKQVKTGERAMFIIQFNAILPDGPYDRANAHGDDVLQSRIYKFTGFYPIPCVYDQEDGWNTDSYLDEGDPFYFDMAYYNLFIEAPNAMIIAATGQLEEKVNKGATTFYHFNPIYPVREVTFSASRYFQVQSKLVHGVNLSTFYLPKSILLWDSYALSNAEQALLLYNSTFGTYPYPTLNIVEEYTSYGGMEYPCQIYATEDVDNYVYPLYINRRILEKIIAHETCHQWWYNLVGNDEVDLPFLDEGITVWCTDYYGEYYHGSWEYFQMTYRYIDRVRLYYSETGLSSKINQSVYQFMATFTDWIYIGYCKAPLILEKLRQTIGHTQFVNGLRLFFEQFEYKHALLSDLQTCFEDVIGSSLDWFFLPWFDNPYLPKYAFKNVKLESGSNNLTLTIEDLNVPLNNYGYRQLVPVIIYDKNETEVYSDNVWIESNTIINIVLPVPPQKISLNYNNYVLVQLDDPMKLSLDYVLKPKPPLISGYDLGIIIIFSIHIIGFVCIITVRKSKKRK
ncbi:MAG: M1 family metallopeptidase [Candidatus Hermodarchaeota archaeon]